MNVANYNGGETISILINFVVNNYKIKYIVNILVWSDTLLHNNILLHKNNRKPKINI